MWEKIVQGVPVRPDLDSDLIGLIDLIEFELRFAGSGPATDRLGEVVEEIRRSEGPVSQAAIAALLDVIGRLEKIEQLLSDAGFETIRRSSRLDGI